MAANRDTNIMENQKEEKIRLLDQAWGHAQLKMFEDAVKDCEALVGLDKDDPYSYIEMGYYYEKSGHVEQTMDCYRYLMSRFPKYSFAYSNLGHVYQTHKKRFDVAMLLYEKALELDSRNVYAVWSIGTIWQKDGEWEKALSYYEKAAGMEEKLHEKEHVYQVLRLLGWAYYRCKKYTDACRVFNRLTLEDHENCAIFSELGCVLYKLGRFKDALASIETALNLCEDSRYYKRQWKTVFRKCS